MTSPESFIALPDEFRPYRQASLEDGEPVVKLRRWKRSGLPSNNSHAGMWGPGVAYILAHMPDGGRHAVMRAVSGAPGLKLVPNDAGFVLLGDPASVRRILQAGPSRLRAQVRRVPSPEEADRLKAFRFKKM